MAKAFIGFLFSVTLITSIFAVLRISLAAFLASFFVGYSPFSSMLGNVSSIFTHAAYNFFTGI